VVIHRWGPFGLVRFPADRRVTYRGAVVAPDPLLDLPGVPALRERVEKRLLAAVESDDPTMTEMASHLVKAGGKRLRPVLAALASATGPGAAGSETAGGSPGAGGEVVGGDGGTRGGAGHDVGDVGEAVSDDAVTGGVACELVHVGSLHHDDVIDEASTRHGVESVNTRWGNLRAILSGDFLLARASELAASLGTEVATLLAATIGRLCEGEVRELQFAYQVDRAEADYVAAIEGKTAALYSTACRIGGLVAGFPRHHVDALTRFGLHYGMAFQVVDDVLDVVATADELGKPAGHDMAEGIYNLPVLRTMPGPDGDELRGLLGAPIDPQAQARALALVRRGDGVTQSIAEAGRYVHAADHALDPLPPSPARDALGAAARHLLAGVTP
jgi:heptaprenyl diphosphate synthase